MLMQYMVTTNRKRLGILRAFGPFDNAYQAQQFMLDLCKKDNLSIDEIINEVEGVGIEGRETNYNIMPLVSTPTFDNKRQMIDVYCPAEVVNDFVHNYKIDPAIDLLEEPVENFEVELMKATSRFIAAIEDISETEKRRAWANALDQLVTWYTG